MSDEWDGAAWQKAATQMDMAVGTAYEALRDAAVARQKFYLSSPEGQEMERRAKALYVDRNQFSAEVMDNPVMKGPPMHHGGAVAIMGEIIPAWAVYLPEVMEHERLRKLWNGS